MSRISSAAAAIAATATQVERAADADALRAGLDDLGIDRPGCASTFTRLRDVASHDRADLVAAAQAGRVEHVGARALVGLQARDRVVEVGVAADVVLGSRGEREREVERAGRLDAPPRRARPRASSS